MAQRLAGASTKIACVKTLSVRPFDCTDTWLFMLALGTQFSISVWAKEAQAPHVSCGIQDQNEQWGQNEQWAWNKISRDHDANFDENCNAVPPDARPNDGCRRLKAQFVVDILTNKQCSDQIQTARIRLIGALIEGDIDLEDADFSGREVSIENSVVGGRFTLDAAKVDQMSLRNSTVTGEVSAMYFTAGRTLDLSCTTFENAVRLNGANIGVVSMPNAKFKGELDLTRVQTAADLNMSCADAGVVNAHYANIGGDLDMRRFHYHKLDLYGATVQKNLKIGQHRSTSFDCPDGPLGNSAELILQNTQVGNLHDYESDGQFPNEIFPTLQLDGFSVSHLENKHSADWWRKLIELNKTYSPHPQSADCRGLRGEWRRRLG
jgi:hypothetical protein